MEPESRKKVLVADDDKDVTNCIELVLKDKYDVIKVNDGVLCVAVAMKSKPDLLLLDITMPKMSGYQVMDNFKRNPQLKDVPIILVTGKTSLQEKDFGYRKGAVGYITKPFEMAELVKMVDKVLSPQSPESSEPSAPSS